MAGLYVLTTGADPTAALEAVPGVGPVTVVVIGPREAAEAASSTATQLVRWCEPAPGVPAEAYAPALAALVAAASPQVVAASTAPADRALLGAVAAALHAVLLPGVQGVTDRDGRLVVERAAVGGAVVQTLLVDAPLALTVGPAHDAPTHGAGPAAPIEPLALEPVAGATASTQPSGTPASGLTEAARVVGVGRGLRARADLELVTRLAEALGAEVGCTMPVADDLGWLEKSRYIGRSGQTVAPRLYLAVGVSGAPQHLEGIRGAKVVVAIDLDPGAPIFRRADYGIAGDLYQVVPALIEALRG